MSAINLQSLSNESLVDRLNALVTCEHECTIEVLHHLNEVERRRLYRDYGYSSMFTYCTERLGYCASAASRRIGTARAIRRCPAVLELLARREVSLTTVYKVAGIACRRNEPSIFERIRGKTLNEVEAIAAEYNPTRRHRDRTSTVYVHEDVAPDTGGVVPPGAPGTGGAGAAAGSGITQSPVAPEAGANGGDETDRTSVASGSAACDEREEMSTAVCPHEAPSDSTFKAAREIGLNSRRLVKKYKHHFLCSEELQRSLDRARVVLRLSANAPMEDLLAFLVEEFLKRRCPKRRRERRRRKEAATRSDDSTADDRRRQEEASRRMGKGVEGNATADGASGGGHTPWGCNGEKENSSGAYDQRAASIGTAPTGENRRNPRYIPVAVRDETMARAGHRCCFAGIDGVRCTETENLQIDHVVPVVLGGTSHPENLRVLCAAHNILAAERLLGKALMDRYRRWG